MIETVSETGSTNADLLERLSAGESIPEGFWLRAERQSGGRGRSGREWVSPVGNLYTSTVVNLRESDPPPQTLALVIGLGVHRHIKASLLPDDRPGAQLKWPNDVLVHGAKIVGILLERVGNTIVAGIGVNLGFAPEIPGRETACIRDLNPDAEVNPGKWLEAMAPFISEELDSWRHLGVSGLMDRWCRSAHPVGSELAINGGDGGIIHGTFAGLDENGGLLLRLANGSVQTIHAGDVALISEGISNAFGC